MQTTCLEKSIRKKQTSLVRTQPLNPNKKKELHHFTTMKPQKK